MMRAIGRGVRRSGGIVGLGGVVGSVVGVGRGSGCGCGTARSSLSLEGGVRAR